MQHIIQARRAAKVSLLCLGHFGPVLVLECRVEGVEQVGRSQSRRFAQLVAGPREGEKTDREASAALRFLLDHGDQGAVAAAVPGGLPTLDWDSIPASRERRDQAATRILAGADMRYLSEHSNWRERGDRVELNARGNTATPTAGYDWVLDVSAWDRTLRHAGGDTVSVSFDTALSVAHVIVGTDSLAFDLGRLASGLAGKSVLLRNDVSGEDLRLEAVTTRRRGALALQSLSARRTGDWLRVDSWEGKLLLGRPK